MARDTHQLSTAAPQLAHSDPLCDEPVSLPAKSDTVNQLPADPEIPSLLWAKALAGVSLATAGILLAVQQRPSLQRLHRVLAGAGTMVPIGLIGWAVGGYALTSLTRGKTRTAAVAAVVGAGLLHASGLIKRFGGRRTTPSSDQLRVVMLNVEYGQADTAELIHHAQQVDADVIVIIEHHPRTEDDLVSLGRRYPYRIGHPTLDAEGTLILSRTPLIERAHVGEVYHNYVVGTRVRGVNWTVAAVHPYPPVTTATEWVEDSRRVADMVAPFIDENLVVIGDFNATIDQVTMNDFTGLGLTNAALQTGAGWEATWPLGYPLLPFAALDHALTSPRVVANHVETFEVSGTDHKGLAVTVSVRR